MTFITIIIYYLASKQLFNCWSLLIVCIFSTFCWYGNKICKLRIHKRKLDVVFISDAETGVKILAWKFIVVMKIMTKHCWDVAGPMFLDTLYILAVSFRGCGWLAANWPMLWGLKQCIMYRARQKSNPVGKILYLWNCSRFFHQILDQSSPDYVSRRGRHRSLQRLFRFSISCSVPEIFAIEVRCRPKSRQKSMFFGRKFFGEDPQFWT